ncbi:MAG: hypothetical protein RIM83_17945 [Allomuricauda sp.]
MEIENKNKNLFNDQFILDVNDKKLYFDISREGWSIQLSGVLDNLTDPYKYIETFLELYKSNYDTIASLNLPIKSSYDEKNNIYIYNVGNEIEYFKDRQTWSFKDYGFKEKVYYKATNKNSNVIVLLGYSINKSKMNIMESVLGTNNKNTQEKNKSIIESNRNEFDMKNLKDLTITINYFSQEKFDILVNNIEKNHNEFLEFKRNEIERENEKSINLKKLKDSIGSSNAKKI